MPRFRQRGRPDSATPMRVPDPYSESDSDDRSSEAAHTPPSSDEHPSPPKREPVKTKDAGRRTLHQIVQEASLCAASLEAFDRDDQAFEKLTKRLSFLKDEYQKAQKGDHENDRGRGCVGRYIQEYLNDSHPHYNERYDELTEVDNNIRGFTRPFAYIGSMDGHFVSAVSSLSGSSSAVKKPDNVVGGMFGRHRQSCMPRERNLESQSSSRADDVAPASVEDKIAPFANMGYYQDSEQFVRKKWSTVKVKTADKKLNIAYADRSDFQVEDRNPRLQLPVPWVKTSDVKKEEEQEVEERVSPKLKTFHEVHYQLREQDGLPPYKYSPQDRDWKPVPSSELPDEWFIYRPPLHCLNGWLKCNTCTACTSKEVTTAGPKNSAPDQELQDAHLGASTVKVYNIDSSLLRNGIKITDLPPRSDVSHRKVHARSPITKDGVVTANTPTHKQNQSTATVAEEKKQVTTKMDRTQERRHMVYDDLSDSDSEVVPVIPKLGHPTKASDVKTATGFAASRNSAAPDEIMVDDFLEATDYRFTRDEAFEILRMCGANLIAAVSMYHNALGPGHLRQMLRAWLAPLENADFRTSARFYTEKIDNQGKLWGTSSEKEVGVEENEYQPVATVMSVRNALAVLGLDAYNSVDRATLVSNFQTQCGWQESRSQAREQLTQAFDTVVRHHDNENCWKLCPIPWTKAMDEKLMRWKTEDTKMTWTTIGEALWITPDECESRFRTIQPKDWKPNPTKEGESEKQQQKDTIRAASVWTAQPELEGWGGSLRDDWGPPHHCEKCDHGYHDLNHDCEADRAAVNSNHSVHDPQTTWGDGGVPTTAPKPKAPVPAAYTVTYWATIESDDKRIHIPIDSSNVSGPQKAIIESRNGMRKVWKWVQKKGLSNKVGLQDAFNLAKDMYGEDENEESVNEGLESVRSVSRASSSWPSDNSFIETENEHQFELGSSY